MTELLFFKMNWVSFLVKINLIFRIKIQIVFGILDADEGIYGLILYSSLRSIVFDGLDDNSVNRLKKIRPTPSFNIVIATTENMNKIFETVNLYIYHILSCICHIYTS